MDSSAVAAGSVVGLVIGVIIGVLILLLLGMLLRLLWNSTLPDVLNVKPVTTWQAIKLLFIASLLFGGHRVVTTHAPAETGSMPPAAGAAIE